MSGTLRGASGGLRASQGVSGIFRSWSRALRCIPEVIWGFHDVSRRSWDIEGRSVLFQGVPGQCSVFHGFSGAFLRFSVYKVSETFRMISESSKGIPGGSIMIHLI